MSDNSSNKTDVSTIHLDNISLAERENIDSNSNFIGFDLSTQQLKAIVIDDKLKVCHQVGVNFDQELAEYKTKGGVYRSDDGSNSVSAPVNMWLKALDMCFEKLKLDGLDFGSVLAISGCAQQHGSVWWRRESHQLLANMSPDEYLHKELVTAFSLRESPIWMDSSTSEECRELEQQLGGPGELAKLTGSRAYERFTAAQIKRVFKRRREAYMVTERITLVGNFLASVLCGRYAPFDASDASGMNMMDLRAKSWSRACLEAIVQGDQNELAGLRSRLGCGPAPSAAASAQQVPGASLAAAATNLDNIVDSHRVVGRISRYFVQRYAFPPECLVASFTGDNPASMAGLCVRPDELVLSLGTSDTAFFWLGEPRPGVNGHVLRNPLDENAYMGLICFKNGSKTRERIRNVCARADWTEFGRLLESVPRGNFGNIGFYYDLREIYPLVSGDFRFNKLDQRVDSFSNELEIRALLEGQFMRLYMHSRALGLDMKSIKRILVTGGASTNKSILQVIADVFRSPVYTLDLANSACLGGAYMAKYAYELEQHKLDRSIKLAFGEQLTDVEDEEDYEEPADGALVDGQSETATPTGAGDEQQQQQQQQLAASQGRRARNRVVDFAEMILGSDESEHKNLIRCAEPTPIGSQLDVYEALMERYARLEHEISVNNDASLQ